MVIEGREASIERKLAPKSPAVAELFAGAPLDVVKLVAACLMVVDHVNIVFLSHDANVAWKLGRIAFPLFAFALVCNLLRETRVPEYVGMLLLLGAVSQPLYAMALGGTDGNTLFTLAVGAAILTVLKSRNLLLQHAIFFSGVAAIFSPLVRARSGLDFGLAGMLFPAALFLVMEGRRSHAVWLALLLVGLNWHHPNPWQLAPIATAFYAGAGGIAVLMLAVAFRNRPRFLPRYALHIFYPGHLLLLMTITAWLGSTTVKWRVLQLAEQPEMSQIADADAALKRGDLFKAYDIAAAALDQFPNSPRLRYLTVLALARSGAIQSAQEFYEQFDLASHDGVDERSLGARLLKDLAFESQPAASVQLLQAASAYHRIFEQTGDYFPGINAATLFLLAGDTSTSEQIAHRILSDPVLQSDVGYYAAATAAEAQLLLDHTIEAGQMLVRARSLAGNDFSSLATTRKQLARILEHRGLDAGSSGVLASLAIPRVAFYCGHMVAGPGAHDEGWQSKLSSKLDAAIEKNNIGTAFGGLACGADILFAEAFLRKGIELNIVLPFKQEDYLKYSVEPGGGQWITRFWSCLNRAATVTFASPDEYVGDPAQFSYGSAVAMGMAHLRARHLQTEAVQLAAFDGVSMAGRAGTAADIEAWQRFGGKSDCIEFERPAAGLKNEKSAIDHPDEAAGILSRQVHSIIFADIHGFSKIPESRIPLFWNGIMSRCAATIGSHGKHVLYCNTWGDALYLIVDDVADAADLALSLHNCVTADDARELGLATVPRLRVALHHGPLFEGYDPVRGEPTFFGSEVSRTARIEPVTPLGAVFATEPFAAILAMRTGSKYSCNYAGRIDLAKKYGAYRMYRLARTGNIEL